MKQMDWLKCVDDFLPREVISEAYGIFSNAMLPPGTTYIRPENLNSPASYSNCKSTIALFFLEFAARALEAAQLDSWTQFEVWTNRSTHCSDHVDYHLDNNEELRRQTQKIETPKCGFILYLGPDSSGIGGTYFNPPIVSPEADKNLFRHPRMEDVTTTSGIYIPFNVGRLVVFDGRAPHCVVPFSHSPKGTRVALLGNAWA